MNKVVQKPTPRVPRNKKSEAGSRQAKKDNEGMKVSCNFCGYEHEKNREKCPAWGKTFAVKVEMTVSPNARKYMPYHTPKMVMIIMKTSGHGRKP